MLQSVNNDYNYNYDELEYLKMTTSQKFQSLRRPKFISKQVLKSKSKISSIKLT